MNMEGKGEISDLHPEDEFQLESLVLRRSHPEDTPQIQALGDVGKTASYQNLFGQKGVLHIIETAYLSISVLQDGEIIAFAAFEDYPWAIKGFKNESEEENRWEDVIKEAWDAPDVSPLNSVFLNLFLFSTGVKEEMERDILKKIIQSVYTSLPELESVLFNIRGEADQEDVAQILGPVLDLFEVVEPKVEKESVLMKVDGMLPNSRLLISNRVRVLPLVEIREAKQEDHDDLAAVFNSQSEVQTGTFGEYFIAELIAAQNPENRAIVAQVKEKAVGLMGITKEVDVNLMHKCFELDCYDNLIKPEYMNAVRNRRQVIEDQLRAEEKLKHENNLKRVKEETIICNRIAQRIDLQEFCLRKATDIINMIEQLVQNLEDVKSLDRNEVERIMDEWLDGFEIKQPSNYFLDTPTADTELVCNILTKKEFLINTLEMFGLTEKYMEGEGHFPDWGEKMRQNKAAKDKKRSIAQRMKEKKQKTAVRKSTKKTSLKEDEEAKPTYFDLEPFLKAFKRFIAADGNARSLIRVQLGKLPKEAKSLFVDPEDHEPTFKKCLNIMGMGKKLNEKGYELPAGVADVIGPILICFGEIAYEFKTVTKKAYELRDPEEDKDKDPLFAKFKGKRKKEEEERAEEMKKDVIVNEYNTSIHDFLQAIDKSRDYDYTLYNLGFLSADLNEELTPEDQKLELEEEGEEEGKDIEEIAERQHTEEEDIFGEGADEMDFADSDEEGGREGAIISPPSEVSGRARSAFSEARYLYSQDPEYENIIKELGDLNSIPDPPEKAKNAFAVTLFCLETAFESRAIDFLSYAFSLFPHRDYLIVTQPHTVPETSLLKSFSQVKKKTESTFSHVLYVMHRDALLTKEIKVRKAEESDLDQVKSFLDTSEQKLEVIEEINNAVLNKEKHRIAYLALIREEIIGLVVLSRDVNIPYYTSHFHIQEYMLLNEFERNTHCRLITYVINPIFERSSRTIIKEALRLTGKVSIYFEIHDRTIIPPIFHEMVHVRSRRFPHFLKRNWDHERFDHAEFVDFNKEEDGGKLDPIDEKESNFSMSFLSKKMISEPKIINNTRIVVVGASDTGIAFLERLLSIRYLQFTHIVLLAPGGLPNKHTGHNLKAFSTSYTMEEINRLLLESRVQVIDARMTDIDRENKAVCLYDDTIIPYDTLIFAMGLQDKTLQSLGYVSRGIAPIPEGLKRMEGLISIDDPSLYIHLREDGYIMSKIAHKKKPQEVAVYGRSIHTFACIYGLMKYGVPARKITLAIPDVYSHAEHGFDNQEELIEMIDIINPPAFEDEDLEEMMIAHLEELGVNILRDVELKEFRADEDDELECVVFEKNGEEVEESLDQEEKDRLAADAERRGQLDFLGVSKSQMYNEDYDEDEDEEDEEEEKINKNLRLVHAKVCITAGHRDVDIDVFTSIHKNSLVYNGRLIVEKNFQTSDPSIFAGGSLCEFSGRYKAFAHGKCLSMDRFNGREIGFKMARSLLEVQDPLIGSMEQSSIMDEILPDFYLPQGMGAMIPGNLQYYHIKMRNKLQINKDLAMQKNRHHLISNNLTGTKGHYIKFVFNEIGIIEAVTYLGSEQIVLNSLWSFVGLHENYLNSLTSRFDKGIIPNVVEFLSENWAMALYQDWFADFTFRVKKEIQSSADVQEILRKVSDISSEGKGIDRGQLEELYGLMDPKTKHYIEEETLAFIKANLNHLPMYYIPQTEFP